jgi:hypothetical protein
MVLPNLSLVLMKALVPVSHLSTLLGGARPGDLPPSTGVQRVHRAWKQPFCEALSPKQICPSDGAPVPTHTCVWTLSDPSRGACDWFTTSSPGSPSPGSLTSSTILSLTGHGTNTAIVVADQHTLSNASPSQCCPK